LRPGDRKELEGWVRARTTSQRRVERARIILGSAGDCQAGPWPARSASRCPPCSDGWTDTTREGLAGLEDPPRPGRPRSRITPKVKAEVVRRTLEEKPLRGTHWSTRLMAECIGLHHSQVGRIWNAHGLKLHRVRYFKLSTDPRFVEKLREVVGL